MERSNRLAAPVVYAQDVEQARSVQGKDLNLVAGLDIEFAGSLGAQKGIVFSE